MNTEDIIKQRQQLLDLLYQDRLTEKGTQKNWVKAKDIIDLLGECPFNLGILIELGYIKKDGNRYRITGQGVLAAEQSPSR